jgi:hypothetical protein
LSYELSSQLLCTLLIVLCPWPLQCRYQTTIAMHENVARQLRDFLEEPIALEWGGLGDGLPILTMDPMRYLLENDGEELSTSGGR